MKSNSFLDDFKYAWNKPNNSLARLIILNVIVFVIANILMLFSTTEIFNDYISKNFAMPVKLDELIFRPWTVITSFFTHFGFSHILWNMLFLYWFGVLIRDYLGDSKLISLYVLGGLAGGLAVLVLFNFVPRFMEASGGIALGASAAVYAIEIGAATLLPNHTFNLLFFGPVKIKYIAAISVFLAFVGLKGYNTGGELAHLSGAFVGYIYIRQLQKGNDLGNWVTNVITFIKSFFVKQPRMKVNYSNPKRNKRTSSSTRRPARSGSKSPKTPDQDEIDAILDKISQSGYESLSKEEKQKLFNASKK